ncbi:hypothetical protein OAH97_01075 [Octadecabacter sp.]|nr:hypothetical protein [Octadecabacter sp.]
MMNYSPSEAFKTAQNSVETLIETFQNSKAAMTAHRNALVTIQNEIDDLCKIRKGENGEKNDAEAKVAQIEREINSSETKPSDKSALNENLTSTEVALTEVRAKIKARDSQIRESKSALERAETAYRAAKTAYENVRIDLKDCANALVAELNVADILLVTKLLQKQVISGSLADQDMQNFAAGSVKVESVGKPADRMSDLDTLTITSPEFEDRILMFVDHLTARRIAEEMDTPTYLSRLGTFVDRANSRAVLLNNQTVPQLAEIITEERYMIQDLRRQLTHEIERLSAFLDPDEVTRLDGLIAQESKTMEDVLDKIDRACVDLTHRISQFCDEICGQTNQFQLRDRVRKVSEQIESGTGIRFWPWLTAFFTVILVGTILTGHLSPYLASHSSKLYGAIFCVCLLASYRFGYAFRENTMKTVRNEQYSSICKLFSPEAETDQIFKISPIPLSHSAAPDPKWRDRKWWPAFKGVQHHRYIMISKNLAIMFAACLLALGKTLIAPANLLSRDDVPAYAFQGRLPAGNGCLIATGDLIRSDDISHFVLPPDRTNNFVATRLFPILYSDAIDRRHVREIVLFNPDVHDFMQDCRVQTPLVEGNTSPTPEINVTVPVNVSVPGVSELVTTGDELTDQVATLASNISEIQSVPSQFATYISQETASANTADTALWTYQIVQEGRLVLESTNSLLLLFFPIEIKDTENSEILAFQRGLEAMSSSNESKEFDQGREFYLAQLARIVLQELAQESSEITIDVQGFASERWIGSTDDDERDALNYALAEGRRFSVILALADKIAPELQGRVMVAGVSGCRSLNELSSLIPILTRDSFPAFKSPGAMQTARSEMMSEHNIEAEDPFRDFAQRSVFVSMRSGENLCVEH